MTTAPVRERTEQTTGRWLLIANGGETSFDNFDTALATVKTLAEQGATGEWKIFKSTSDGFHVYKRGSFPTKEAALSSKRE